VKNLNELSDQEILELSDPQIEKIIQYKMAEEGIKLFKKPIEPEYEEEKEKDLVFWKIDGLSFLFANQEDAVTIAEQLLLKQKNMFTDTWDSSTPKSLETDRDYSGNVRERFHISNVMYYSQERHAEATITVKQNKKAKETYDKLLKEYEEAYEASQYIRDEVWNKVFEIRDKYTNFDRLKNLFSQYLELAEKNEEIAWNFLKKAEIVDEEAENFIKEFLKE
jgi:hypothetical protein